MFELPATGEAIFFNWTDKPFVGEWDGQTRTFQPGERANLAAYRARHYASHLTNQVLNELGGVYETYCSPKRPQDVPAFMERFNKAYLPINATGAGSEADTKERERLELLEIRGQLNSDLGTPTAPTKPEPQDDEDDFEDEPSVPTVEEKEPTEEESEKATLQQEAKALKVPGWHLLGVENLKKQIALKKEKAT